MKTGTTKDGRKTYTISIGILNAPDRFWQEEKSVKLIQKYFPELDIYEFGVFDFVKVNGKNAKPIQTFELEMPGYSARNVK